MLSLFTRRVALSAYRSTATYARISASSAPTLRGRGLPDTSLHSNTVPAFTNPQRNVSTEAAVATKKTKSSAESTTGGRRKSQRNLTPEQKAARKQLLQAKRELDNKKKAERAVALEVKRKARAEKEKEAAALKRKRLAEKAEKERKRKKAEAKAEKAEAKKPRIIKPPPRRMSPCSLFLHETKRPLKEGFADWKNLSEEVKQEYVVRAGAVAKKRREEFDAYMETVTRMDLNRYNRLQRSKGRFGIRVKRTASHPLGPFMRYVMEFRKRPDQAGKRQREVTKAAAVAWHTLTQEEKDQYKSKPAESTTA